MTSDLHWWTAGDLAAAIRGREVSAREALEHFVERIERLDGPINSVVQWDLDRARAAAHAADEAVARRRQARPAARRADDDQGLVPDRGLHHHVRRARLAPSTCPTPTPGRSPGCARPGAIPFAKTNLPIFAGDIQTYNDVYGTTNNPHDLEPHVRRVVGRVGGGAGDGLHADRARLRHRRLDPRARRTTAG